MVSDTLEPKEWTGGWTREQLVLLRDNHVSSLRIYGPVIVTLTQMGKS